MQKNLANVQATGYSTGYKRLSTTEESIHKDSITVIKYQFGITKLLLQVVQPGYKKSKKFTIATDY
jgi:hypothetical protein